MLGTILVHGMRLGSFFPGISTVNPPNTLVVSPLLATNYASMKLWEAPPLINTVTFCPCMVPLTQGV